MMDDPKEHDFNWVKAHRECSVLCEYGHLRNAVEASVKERNADDIQFRILNEDHFSVCRLQPGSPPASENYDHCVHFSRNPKEIKITDATRGGKDKSCSLSLTLNDNGDCRYQINGGGEFLRWQVAKLALQGIFRMGSRKKRRLVWP